MSWLSFSLFASNALPIIKFIISWNCSIFSSADAPTTGTCCVTSSGKPEHSPCAFSLSFSVCSAFSSFSCCFKATPPLKGPLPANAPFPDILPAFLAPCSETAAHSFKAFSISSSNTSSDIIKPFPDSIILSSALLIAFSWYPFSFRTFTCFSRRICNSV